MIIQRRKEKKKNRNDEEKVSREKDRKKKWIDNKPITKSLQSAKGNAAAELECTRQEVTVHWHPFDDLILRVSIKTHVAVISQTVSEAWKEQFLSSSSVAPLPLVDSDRDLQGTSCKATILAESEEQALLGLRVKPHFGCRDCLNKWGCLGGSVG